MVEAERCRWEITFFHDDLTFSTRLASSADRLQFDPQLAGGCQ
jgi:hypothetical protein